MSFYLGNDSNGNGVMHMTNSNTSVSLLKSGILSNTIFHSSLRYLTYRIYNASNYIDYFLNGWYDTTSMEFSSECVNDIITNNACYAIIVNNQIVNYTDYYKAEIPIGSNIPIAVSIGTWYASNSYASGNQIYYDDYTNTPAYGYRFKKLQGSGKRNVQIVVFNVSRNGVYIMPNKDSSGIKMLSNDIAINGISLLNFKYVSSKILNGVDPIITNGSTTYQLVNSNIRPPLSIISNSVKSEITSGGIPIFSTLYGNVNVAFKSSMYFYAAYRSNPSLYPANILYTTTNSVGFPRYFVLASNDIFVENENFILTLGNGTSDVIYLSTICTYNELKEIAILNIGQTGPATATKWTISCYSGKLCLTWEVVHFTNPPMSTGPIDISTVVIKLYN